jgi:hypothetical protein
VIIKKGQAEASEHPRCHPEKRRKALIQEPSTRPSSEMDAG